MKVIKSHDGNSWNVVADASGTQFTTKGGQKTAFEPIPVCRVPVGFGRTDEQAFAIAQEIVSLMSYPDGGKTGHDEEAQDRLDYLRGK